MMEKKDKQKETELQPLSKEDALESINQLKRNFGLFDIQTNQENIRGILKKSGLLSDEVTLMRREQET